MKELEKFLFQPKNFEDIIKTAIIVVDTNVLLAAYQYREITFKELLHTLDELKKEGRLLIPSQVIKEFSVNRPKRIVEIIQQVEQLRDGLPSVKELDKIESKVPGMDFLQINSSIQAKQTNFLSAQKNYRGKIKEYHKELSNLIAELKTFFTNDPILEKYTDILKEAYFRPDSLKTEDEMSSDFKLRVKEGRPPGNKDASKETNSEGDYIIWEHILRIENSDVIFVSADNKTDWVYRDSKGKVLGARRELIEEFFEISEGYSFSIVHPSTFISSYNPSVDEEVIEDLDIKSKETNKVIFNEYLNDYTIKMKEGFWEEYISKNQNSLDENSPYSNFVISPFFNQEAQDSKGLKYLELELLKLLKGDRPGKKLLAAQTIQRALEINKDETLTLAEKDDKYARLGLLLSLGEL